MLYYLKRILFRVDADRLIGMGHLMRCLTLAKNLRALGVESYFLTKINLQSSQLVNDYHFCLFTLPQGINNEKELSTIVKLHSKIKFDGLVIDLRKSKPKSFFKKVNKICKTIVIGYLFHKNYFNADLIVLPEIKEQYPEDVILKSPQKLLIGPKYALLANSFPKKTKTRQKNSILVSMGGSDKIGFTEKIINAFKKSQENFHMSIVIGKFFKNDKHLIKIIDDDKRFHLIINNNNLIPLMQSSQIGIFTMGITPYEAFFARLPSIVISNSKVNHLAANKLLKYDCFNYLGHYKFINSKEIPFRAFALMKNSALSKKYCLNGKKLVDGKGSLRIAKKIAKIIDE